MMKDKPEPKWMNANADEYCLQKLGWMIAVWQCLLQTDRTCNAQTALALINGLAFRKFSPKIALRA